MPITGVHTMLYSANAEATRAFLRDKLRFPCVDAGDGWLIFDMPSADMGCHPVGDGGPPVCSHDVSFFCDDIASTVAELAGRGVEFTGPVEDHGYGLVTHIVIPGGLTVQLYQPLYPKG
jgi:predicted enzyme related to lactoylglutathione lyase